jgi:hypothetical protein
VTRIIADLSRSNFVGVVLPEVDSKVENRRHRAAGDAPRRRLPGRFQADKLAAEFKFSFKKMQRR